MAELTPAHTHSGKTLLIVDDTPENLQILGAFLQPLYRVLVANSGPSALTVARATPHPDLILLDIMMPEMDGYEVLRRLRSDPETADIPVIFVTALDAVDDEARGLALGAVDYITKPVMPALLMARIRTQLEIKDAKDWLKDRNAVLASEVARQVVALKAAKEAAEAASRSKSIFIDTMSVELRSPMNGIIGMLQLAHAELPADHPVQEYLTSALGTSKDMVELLSEILEYARVAHNEVSLKKQTLDLRNLFAAVALPWRARCAEKGLDFRTAIDSGAPAEILADEKHLVRALELLLDNACKFTASGMVELGANSSPAGLHLWVRDTGVGIPAEAHERIFHPFEQVDGSRSRCFGGVGLGLAIARHVVELMEGKLWFESSPGTGSIFHITLPLTSS